jgi:cytochrome o ubiquinol oxidase subunit 3
MSTAIAHETETTRLGFWFYLMTDCMLFASLFATYAVLSGSTAGGPGAKELFSLPYVLIETVILLVSSMLSGIMLLALRTNKVRLALQLLTGVIILGASFLALELYEFRTLFQEGHTWQSSGFLSSFFTLVGTHGLHITIGLLWAIVIGIKLSQKGVSDTLIRKTSLFTIFWHFLDVVWIFIFTFVYMTGGVL